MHRKRPLDGQKESFRTIPGILPYHSGNGTEGFPEGYGTVLPASTAIL